MANITLTTTQACQYLDAEHGLTVSPATLTSKRCRGDGPEFEKFIGKVIYRPRKLDAWAAAHTTTHNHTT